MFSVFFPAVAAVIGAAVPDAYVRWDKQPSGFGKQVDIALDVIAAKSLGMTDAVRRRFQASSPGAELMKSQCSLKRLVVRCKAESTEATDAGTAINAIESVRDYLRYRDARVALWASMIVFVDAGESVDLTYQADRHTIPAAYTDLIFYAVFERTRSAVPYIETVSIRRKEAHASGFGVGYA